MEAPQPQANPYGAPLARVEDATSGEVPGILARARSVPARHALAWYREAWRLYKIAPGAWIGVWVLFVLLAFGISVLPFLGILSPLVTPILVAGVMIAARAADREGAVRVGSLFAGFSSHAGPLLLIGLLQLTLWFVFLVVASIAGIAYIGFTMGSQLASGKFTFDALLPLFVMGFVVGLVYLPITIAVWLAAGLVALHDVAALDALRMGFSAAFRTLLPLLLFALVTVALAFA